MVFLGVRAERSGNAVDTSSAAAVKIVVVDDVAAALAALSVDSMLVRSVATAAITSGAALNNDIPNLQAVIRSHTSR